MPEWLKTIGFFGLVLLGLIILGGVSGIVIVWLSHFWDAARRGHQKIKPVAEIITGLSYLVIFWFLVFACWYEMRFLWQHNQPVFWSVVIAVAILASKWWLTHGKYAEKQKDISLGNLGHEDKFSVFYGIESYEEVRLAEEIKSDFAKGLEKHGFLVPVSALQYSVEDIKRAFKILSVHDRCDEEYREILRNGFGNLSNICSDRDAELVQLKVSEGHTGLSEQQRSRFHFLIRRQQIRYNILNYEWDEWMLENNIKQSDSYDDMKRQADELNLIADDPRDINPGNIPSKEELISNREKREKNVPSV